MKDDTWRIEAVLESTTAMEQVIHSAVDEWRLQFPACVQAEKAQLWAQTVTVWLFNQRLQINHIRFTDEKLRC